jgi:hypothetical protein
MKEIEISLDDVSMHAKPRPNALFLHNPTNQTIFVDVYRHIFYLVKNNTDPNIKSAIKSLTTALIGPETVYELGIQRPNSALVEAIRKDCFKIYAVKNLGHPDLVVSSKPGELNDTVTVIIIHILMMVLKNPVGKSPVINPMFVCFNAKIPDETDLIQLHPRRFGGKAIDHIADTYITLVKDGYFTTKGKGVGNLRDLQRMRFFGYQLSLAPVIKCYWVYGYLTAGQRYDYKEVSSLAPSAVSNILFKPECSDAIESILAECFGLNGKSPSKYKYVGGAASLITAWESELISQVSKKNNYNDCFVQRTLPKSLSFTGKKRTSILWREQFGENFIKLTKLLSCKGRSKAGPGYDGITPLDHGSFFSVLKSKIENNLKTKMPSGAAQ